MASVQVEWSKTVNTCSAVERCRSDDYDDDDHEAGFSIRAAGGQNSPAISC